MLLVNDLPTDEYLEPSIQKGSHRTSEGSLAQTPVDGHVVVWVAWPPRPATHLISLQHLAT